MPKGIGRSLPDLFTDSKNLYELRNDEAGFSPAQRAQAAFQRALTETAERAGVAAIIKPRTNAILKFLGL